MPNTHSHQHFSIIVCPIGDLRHSTEPNPNLGFNQRTKHHFSHQIEQYTSRLTDRFRCKCNTFFGFVSIFAALHTGHQQSIDSRKCTISFFIRFFLFVFFLLRTTAPLQRYFVQNEFHLQPFFTLLFILLSESTYSRERKKGKQENRIENISCEKWCTIPGIFRRKRAHGFHDSCGSLISIRKLKTANGFWYFAFATHFTR